MEKNKTKQIGKGLLSLGIGSIVAYYFLEITRLQVLPLSVKIREIITKGEVIEITGSQIFTIDILLLGIISLLTAPLFIKWNKNTGYKILAILFLVFADIGAVVSVVAKGKIFPLYIVLIWGTFVFLTWLCIDLFNMIEVWLRAEEEKYDLVKLTFIWTVIAFLIGKIW